MPHKILRTAVAIYTWHNWLHLPWPSVLEHSLWHSSSVMIEHGTVMSLKHRRGEGSNRLKLGRLNLCTISSGNLERENPFKYIYFIWFWDCMEPVSLAKLLPNHMGFKVSKIISMLTPHKVCIWNWPFWTPAWWVGASTPRACPRWGSSRGCSWAEGSSASPPACRCCTRCSTAGLPPSPGPPPSHI